MKKIPVPTICQYPNLPTGCESVAATMVLQYYGYSVSAEEFAKDWLNCNANFHSIDNKLFGPNPHEVFAGNPFSKHSYGCFATPIVDAINLHSLECKAIKIINKSLDELCKEYIEKDAPILIWATMGMKPSKEGRSWYLDDDSKYTWIAGEHCLVLVGYDNNSYFLNDPQTGTCVSYPKELVEQRYKELGMQAVHVNRYPQERGIKINELANISGVTPSTAYSMFDERRRDISIITIKKFCDGLDITLGEFFSTQEFDELEQEIY